MNYRTHNALLSLDEVYRYTLERTWGEGSSLNWVMLNPSTADWRIDDPTIRKVVGFTQRLGHCGILVTNLFAYRATDPKDLVKAEREGIDVVGPQNALHLAQTAQRCGQVICAWGAFSDRPGAAVRVAQVLRILTEAVGERNIWCLERTKSGAPRHPLMAPYKLVTEGRLVPYFPTP